MMMIPVFLSCETATDLGIQYDLDPGANANFIEFNLPATSIYIDSLRTDNEDRMLVGNYTDPIGGSVSTESYFQFFYQSGPLPREEQTQEMPVMEDTLKVDSVILTFEASNIIPFEGNAMQDFSVYTLQDTIANLVYMSTLKRNPDELIGTFSKSINTATDSIYRIKLLDSYAERLFETLGEIAQDSDRFVVTTNFESLALIPNGPSTSIATMLPNSDTSRLILYSSPVDPEAEDTTYVTSFQFNGAEYTYIDRSSATYGQSEAEDRTRFDLPGNQTIIDPLYGISTVYSIAPLREFFTQNPNIYINNATVYFELEDLNQRDTLFNFFTFFEKENGFYGPSVVSRTFTNMVMSDAAYLNGQNIPIISGLGIEKDELLVNSTLFFQAMYNGFRNQGDLIFETNVNDRNFALSEFVLISQSEVTLRRSVIAEDGIKLRLYYTEVN